MEYIGIYCRVAACCVLGLAVMSKSSAQSLPFTTHDWQDEPSGEDRWADVKTPGDGRTYAVGTTLITDIGSPNPIAARRQFSNFGTGVPTGVLPATGLRQVVIVQVSDASGIAWQQYFHGAEPSQTASGGLSTNARAISVWPHPTNPLETRVAICGATHDTLLPEPASPDRSGVSMGMAGWLAVYNGSGTLLWTYNLFGTDVSAITAITDLSIRVDGSEDVVTYCGISTNGDPLPIASTTLSPEKPFVTTGGIGGACVDVGTSGSTHNGLAGVTVQWDGFVGRLSAPHGGPFPLGLGVVAREFHSIVGGHGDDGLFGLHELDRDQFVAVGSTTLSSGGPNVVPLTRQEVFNNPAQFCFSNTSWNTFGTVFRFHAGPTRNAAPGNELLLVTSTLIGSEQNATVARDVVWHGGRMYIVGSTNDPTFLSNVTNPALGAMRGASDGFVISCFDPGSGFEHAIYLGGDFDDALTGVAAWNEYPDHIAVSGWTRKDAIPLSEKDFLVASLYRDSSLPNVSPFPLGVVRQLNFGGLGDETPVHMGNVNATFLSSPQFPIPLGSPAGGGIAVDPRGLISVVGSTLGVVDFPVFGGGRQPHANHAPADTDAVRATIEMLPVGVCRTDGTGQCPAPGWSPGPAYTGDGGTTPACALSPFGGIIGTVPALNRMFIDFEGPSPVDATGMTVAVIVDRPPTGSNIHASIMELGFPLLLPLPVLGVESWINPASSTAAGQIYIHPVGSPWASLRVPLGPLPAGPATFTIQFTSLLSAPIAPTTCPVGSSFAYAASPALVFSY